MHTRLSLFCKGIIEAATLAAVVLAPLFFNVTASENFTLSKALLIRALAWLAALAWLVQRLETRGSLLPLKSLAARLPPLALPAALVGLAAALATLVSIDPGISFWGSLGRAQGFYTILAYVVLFLAARQALQSRDQVARLVTAVVATSLPVALYALVQMLDFDPVRWLKDAPGRPSSSIGNPIFVGEYMVMLLPLTAAALVTAWRTARRRAGLSRYLAAAALVVSVGLQLAAILVTQSRGAFLGLLAAGFYLGLLLAARAGDRRLLGGLVIAALTVVGLLFVINLPGSPLAAVREVPYLGRLAQALDPGAVTGRQRAMQWEAGVGLVTSDPARLLVGYGHDTTLYTVGPFTPPDLYRILTPRTDRLHNELLDVLAAGGLVSLAAYLCLFLSAMRLGLAGLGLLGHRRREAWLLAAFSMGGGLLAGATTWVLAGTPAFLAPAFGLGLVVGLGLYLLARAFLVHVPESGATPGIQSKHQQVQNRSKGIAKSPLLAWIWRSVLSLSKGSRPSKIGSIEYRLLLVAGLLAALVGHLVALQFSFGLTVNRTMFWMYLALLAALATQAEDATPSTPPLGRRRRRGRHPPPGADEPGPTALLESAGEDRLVRSLLLGLILGVLLADFLLPQTDLLDPILLGLVGLTWVLGVVLILAGTREGLKLDRSGVTWPVLSLGWALLVPLLLALPRLGRGFHPVAFYLLFLAWLGLTLAGLAVALSRAESSRLPLLRSGRWPLYLGLTLIVGLAIFLTNVSVAQADIYFKAAQLLRDDGRLDASITFHRRALALAPDQDSYHASLAQTYLEQARTAPDASQRATALQEALQATRRATELAPADAVHFWSLGLLYRAIAEGATDPAVCRAWLEEALSPLRRAATLEPNRASLYVEQVWVYLALERYEEAVEASQQALARDDRSAEAHALLGDAYLGLGQLALAEESYRQALALEPDSVEAHRGLAALHLDRGESEAARDEALAALRVAPHDYAALKTLALAHQALGSIQEALSAARQARDLAPPSQRAALDTLIAELEEARTR